MSNTATQSRRIRPHTATTAKSERLETRVTPAQKELILKAAVLEGRTLTDFVIDTLGRTAEQVVARHEVRTLRGRDREAFVQALLNPPEPSPKLRQAAKRYRNLKSR